MSANYWDIIKKRISNQSLSEREELLISSFNQKDINRDKKVVESSDKYFHQKQFDENVAWQRMYENVLYVEKGRRLRIAASIIIIVLLGSVSLFTYYHSFSYSNEIQTAHELNSILLSDSSFVQVNRNSLFEYPNLFKRTKREVKLTGEAYFEIQSNPQQPFFIETNNFLIKVVGTSFSVRAYPDEQKQIVSVTSGQVVMMDKKLKAEAPGNKVVLYAGERGVFDKSTGKLTKYGSFDPNYLGWLTNEISFENKTLHEVLAVIEDVFFIKVKCEEDGMMQEKISAQFKENTPEYILHVVAKTYGLNLKKVDEYEYLLTK